MDQLNLKLGSLGDSNHPPNHTSIGLRNESTLLATTGNRLQFERSGATGPKGGDPLEKYKNSTPTLLTGL